MKIYIRFAAVVVIFVSLIIVASFKKNAYQKEIAFFQCNIQTANSEILKVGDKWLLIIGKKMYRGELSEIGNIMLKFYDSDTKIIEPVNNGKNFIVFEIPENSFKDEYDFHGYLVDKYSKYYELYVASPYFT